MVIKMSDEHFNINFELTTNINTDIAVLTAVCNMILENVEDFITELKQSGYSDKQIRVFNELFDAMRFSLDGGKLDDFFTFFDRFLSATTQIPINPRLDQLLTQMTGLISELRSALTNLYLNMNFILERLKQIEADTSVINEIQSLINDFWYFVKNSQFKDAINTYYVYAEALGEYLIDNPMKYQTYRTFGNIN